MSRGAQPATPGGPPPGAQTRPAPAPPTPAIAVQGDGVFRNAFASTVNNLASPFQVAADSDTPPLTRASMAVNGVLGALNAPAELLNTGIAAATAGLSAALPSFPAATLGMLHVGVPHAHAHPPSTTPPAPPIPLPSIGLTALPGCLSVLINGIPAARVGDIGFAPTCGGFTPMFEIFMGSSKVFIGGRRAARMLDITRACMPGGPLGTLGKVMAGAGVAAGALGVASAAAEGDALAAGMAAAQMAADTAALVVQQMMGKDPAIGLSIGMIATGHPNVLIGGFPLPDAEVMVHGLFKLLKGLKGRKRGGAKDGRGSCAHC